MSPWRHHFPLLRARDAVAYLDNAATSQKPQVVLDAMHSHYREFNANVHRATHQLGADATEMFERARATVARHIGDRKPNEVVWTRGTTESINLVANCLVPSLGPERDIVVTTMEHHSNLVPWHMAAERTGATVRAVPLTASGELDMVALAKNVSDRTCVVAVAHVSNVLGIVNPVREIADITQAHGALLLVDGAQAVPHLRVDVTGLGCDFYAFSSHKAYGPTGTGVLWGREELLEPLGPWQGGGEMIETVRLDGFTPQAPPYRFEAGTPHIAGAIGLGAALEFLESLDREEVLAYESRLTDLLRTRLDELGGVQLVGSATSNIPIVSFNLEDVHHSDIGTILDQQGVAVRTGHHCAQPLMTSLDLPGCVRASLSLYNDDSDVEKLVKGLGVARDLLL